MALNDHPSIISEEQAWNLLQRLNSVPHHVLEIQTTPALGHLVLTSAMEPIELVTMHAVAETFKSVIDKMTYGTHFKLVQLLQAENANLTHEDLNMSIDELQN